jgi:hypothetical protein
VRKKYRVRAPKNPDRKPNNCDAMKMPNTTNSRRKLF